METYVLVQMTTEAATKIPHARLWPNKLGMTTPGGWEICWSERAGQWFAGRNLRNGKRRYAYADTPEGALEKARTPGQYTEEED